MIQLGPTGLDITTLKLFYRYRADFESAAKHGVIGNQLYVICKLFRRCLRCDVQANEGYNRLLKVISTRSPNMTLPLLDARTNVKKLLGVGARGACTRWTHVRNKATEVLEAATNFYDSHASVLSIDRWTTPLPSHGLPEETVVSKVYSTISPEARVTASNKWAVCFSLKLHRLFKDIDSRLALFIKDVNSPGGHELQDGDLVYFTSEKSYSLACTVGCRVSLGGGVGVSTAAIVSAPLMIIGNSVTLFEEWLSCKCLSHLNGVLGFSCHKFRLNKCTRVL